MNDPIVDEVRRVREEYAARFNFDLDAIYRDLKEQEARSGLKFVDYSKERAATKSKDLDGPTSTPIPTSDAQGNAQPSSNVK